MKAPVCYLIDKSLFEGWDLTKRKLNWARNPPVKKKNKISLLTETLYVGNSKRYLSHLVPALRIIILTGSSIIMKGDLVDMTIEFTRVKLNYQLEGRIVYACVIYY